MIVFSVILALATAAFVFSVIVAKAWGIDVGAVRFSPSWEVSLWTAMGLGSSIGFLASLVRKGSDNDWVPPLIVILPIFLALFSPFFPTDIGLKEEWSLLEARPMAFSVLGVFLPKLMAVSAFYFLYFAGIGFMIRKSKKRS